MKALKCTIMILVIGFAGLVLASYVEAETADSKLLESDGLTHDNLWDWSSMSQNFSWTLDESGAGMTGRARTDSNGWTPVAGGTTVKGQQLFQYHFLFGRNDDAFDSNILQCSPFGKGQVAMSLQAQDFEVTTNASDIAALEKNFKAEYMSRDADGKLLDRGTMLVDLYTGQKYHTDTVVDGGGKAISNAPGYADYSQSAAGYAWTSQHYFDSGGISKDDLIALFGQDKVDAWMAKTYANGMTNQAYFDQNSGNDEGYFYNVQYTGDEDNPFSADRVLSGTPTIQITNAGNASQVPDGGQGSCSPHDNPTDDPNDPWQPFDPPTSPVPELPPGAMQMIMLMIGGGIGGVKRFFKKQ